MGVVPALGSARVGGARGREGGGAGREEGRVPPTQGPCLWHSLTLPAAVGDQRVAVTRHRWKLGPEARLPFQTEWGRSRRRGDVTLGEPGGHVAGLRWAGRGSRRDFIQGPRGGVGWGQAGQGVQAPSKLGLAGAAAGEGSAVGRARATLTGSHLSHSHSWVRTPRTTSRCPNKSPAECSQQRSSRAPEGGGGRGPRAHERPLRTGPGARHRLKGSEVRPPAATGKQPEHQEVEGACVGVPAL